MQYEDRENMISNYIGAYNQFDIDGMTADLADNRSVLSGTQLTARRSRSATAPF